MLKLLGKPLLLALLLALLPAAAAQASDNPAVQDCAEDDVLDGSYSKGTLHDALNNMPSDVAEYTSCVALVNAALRGDKPTAKGSTNDGDGSGTGSNGPDGEDGKGGSKDGKSSAGGGGDEESKQLAAVSDTIDTAPPSATDTAETANGMPLPVLLSLIALALLALGGGVMLLAKRNPAFADALRRVPHPKRRS